MGGIRMDASGLVEIADGFLGDDGDVRDGTTTGDAGRGGGGGGDADVPALVVAAGFLADLSLATPLTKPSRTRCSLI